MSQLLFNMSNGYLEGLVRGFKGGILKQSDYLNLVQCETLEGERTIGDGLSDEVPPRFVPVPPICLAPFFFNDRKEVCGWLQLLSISLAAKCSDPVDRSSSLRANRAVYFEGCAGRC